MPYKKVDMPVVAKCRGGAEATTWQPSEEAVEARAEKLRYEDFVHNPWFIPHDAWSGVMDMAIHALRLLAGPKRLHNEDLNPSTFFELMDKFTGSGLAYPLVRVRKLIFEIRGGVLSGNARFLENHQDLLCPDDASNYLKAQKKRWDDMEKVIVDERQKLAPDEFLNIVMAHVRRFFPDEYSEWRKHGTRDDGRRYTFETIKGFVKGMEARGELHPPDKDSKSSRERLAVQSTRISSTKYGEIADGESFDPVGNLSPMRTDVAREYLHGGRKKSNRGRSREITSTEVAGSAHVRVLRLEGSHIAIRVARAGDNLVGTSLPGTRTIEVKAAREVDQHHPVGQIVSTGVRPTSHLMRGSQRLRAI